MSLLLAETASGAIFGTALYISGVYAPEIIKAQLLFTHTHMLQVFLGGSATSAIVLHIADSAGYLRKKHRPPANLGFFPYDGNLIGGALVGLGMATTGACPGTSMTQLGLGMTNGLLVVLGGILGAFVFLIARPSMQENDGAAPSTPTISPSDGKPAGIPDKACDIPTALSIQPLVMLLLWVPMCVAIIVAAYMIHGSRLPHIITAGLFPPAFSGLMIGVAQAGVVLLTRHHIGASPAYEDVARWFAHLCSVRRAADGPSRPALMTPSVAFGAGIACSATILRNLLPGAQHSILIEDPAWSLPPILRSIAGGASAGFGARLAGGCTSGHGISGLSKFSLASLATTCAIFAGGMLSAQLLPS